MAGRPCSLSCSPKVRSFAPPRCSCNRTASRRGTQTAPSRGVIVTSCISSIIQRVTCHFFYPSFYNFSPNILLRKHEVGNLTSASLSTPLIKHPSSKSVSNASRVMLLYDKEAKRFLCLSFSSQGCFCSVCCVVRPVRFGRNQASLHRCKREEARRQVLEGSQTMLHPADLGQINSGAPVRIGRRYEQFGFGLFLFYSCPLLMKIGNRLIIHLGVCKLAPRQNSAALFTSEAATTSGSLYHELSQAKRGALIFELPV